MARGSPNAASPPNILAECVDLYLRRRMALLVTQFSEGKIVPLTSILYISTSLIQEHLADQQIEDIVTKAKRNNPLLSITGTLLFTGIHFAQILEGSAKHLDLLMATIMLDVRHDDIIIIERTAIGVRSLADWDMAYTGPSQFVQSHVSRLLGAASIWERGWAAGSLRHLMLEFARS
jgi:hypothetical protein